MCNQINCKQCNKDMNLGSNHHPDFQLWKHPKCKSCHLVKGKQFIFQSSIGWSTNCWLLILLLNAFYFKHTVLFTLESFVWASIVQPQISIWNKTDQNNRGYSICTTWNIVHALWTFVLAEFLARSVWVSSLFIINHCRITLYSPESVLNLNWTTTPATRSNWRAIICVVPSASPPQTGWFLMFIVLNCSYCSQKTGGALFCSRGQDWSTSKTFRRVVRGIQTVLCTIQCFIWQGLIKSQKLLVSGPFSDYPSLLKKNV